MDLAIGQQGDGALVVGLIGIVVNQPMQLRRDRERLQQEEKREAK